MMGRRRWMYIPRRCWDQRVCFDAVVQAQRSPGFVKRASCSVCHLRTPGSVPYKQAGCCIGWPEDIDGIRAVTGALHCRVGISMF